MTRCLRFSPGLRRTTKIELAEKKVYPCTHGFVYVKDLLSAPPDPAESQMPMHLVRVQEPINFTKYEVLSHLDSRAIREPQYVNAKTEGFRLGVQVKRVFEMIE